MGFMNNINEPAVKLHSEVVTVGVTATQLPSHPEASWVQLMHEDASAKIYYGGSTLSLANGFGSLTSRDTTERYPVQNTDVVWVISDTAGIPLRVLWGE